MFIAQRLRVRVGRIVKTGWFALEVAGYRGALDQQTRRWIAENLAVVRGRATAAGTRRTARLA